MLLSEVSLEHGSSGQCLAVVVAPAICFNQCAQVVLGAIGITLGPTRSPWGSPWVPWASPQGPQGWDHPGHHGVPTGSPWGSPCWPVQPCRPHISVTSRLFSLGPHVQKSPVCNGLDLLKMKEERETAQTHGCFACSRKKTGPMAALEDKHFGAVEGRALCRVARLEARRPGAGAETFSTRFPPPASFFSPFLRSRRRRRGRARVLGPGHRDS